MIDGLHISESLNPFFNLAYENYLLREKQGNYLFLWRARPSIIFGRFQNPWRECDCDKVSEDGVCFVRRQSGGGTVFHDEGNLNFSFIKNTREIAKDENLEFIINSLRELSIKLLKNNRNDLVFQYSNNQVKENFKVSGSAFKQTAKRNLHHFTLLVETPVESIKKYLKSTFKNIETKAVKSTPSKVLSLNSLDSSITVNRVIETVSKNLPLAKVNFILEDELKDKLKEEIVRLQSYGWIWGETPKFSLEIEEKKVFVEKGLIKKIIFSKILRI